jgi:hypothetical protein
LIFLFLSTDFLFVTHLIFARARRIFCESHGESLTLAAFFSIARSLMDSANV